MHPMLTGVRLARFEPWQSISAPSPSVASATALAGDLSQNTSEGDAADSLSSDEKGLVHLSRSRLRRGSAPGTEHGPTMDAQPNNKSGVKPPPDAYLASTRRLDTGGMITQVRSASRDG